MLKIENTSEYNKITDWQVSKNLIIQRVMASSTDTVHALNDVIFSQCVTIKLTRVLSATIRMDYGSRMSRYAIKALPTVCWQSVAFIVFYIASSNTAESK